MLDISYNFPNSSIEGNDAVIEEIETEESAEKDLTDNTIHPVLTNTENVSDVEEPFMDSGSSYAPSHSSTMSDSDHYEDHADRGNDNEVQNSETSNQSITKKGKKSVRNPASWKRSVRKRKRMGGEEYESSSKTRRIMKKRSLRDPCIGCRTKCTVKITDLQRGNIFKEFWDSNKSIDQKRQFIASCIEETPVNRNRDRTGIRSGKRKSSLKYFFTLNRQKIQVCQKYFLRTLDVSQTFVRCSLEKRQSSGLVDCDRRGKQISVNKIKDEVRNRIRNHIMSFPCSESHYSRNRSAKKYLGCHLNISRMYELYKEKCESEMVPAEEIGKEWLYSHIFNTEFNLSFAPPAKDTCDACDEFLINLKQAVKPEDRENIQKEYDQHLTEANKRYELKKNDKLRSQETTGEKVLMIDLQKCLPCPKLSNAQSFYSLKLWCFNYTVYDSTEKKANCLMWDESVAGRGGNEMASCLLRYIDSLPKSIHSITIWTDNCPSQNRNSQMIMCYFYILSKFPHVKKICHKFLLRGHTHMEVDSIHSIIEREAKKCPSFQLVTPWDWLQLARISGKNKNFNVFEMTTPDFKDFNKFCNSSESPWQLKKKNSDNKKFLISKVVLMEVRQESPGILFYKTSFDDTTFESVDYNKRAGRKQSSSLENFLTPIRNELNPISTKKYNDLQKLLKWVPQRFHAFYQNLKSEAKTQDESEV